MVTIRVKDVVKVYNLYDSSKDRLKEIISFNSKKYHKEYRALDGINVEIKRGEIFGIIGTNGAGKSTLLKIITGVASPTGGTVEVNGKISALLELGAGFNKDYTGIENIYLNGIMMGYTRAEVKEKINDIIEFADIGDFIHQPVKTYSSGMFARLAFAVAINIEPEVLIVDEALAVGDVFFQNKCYKKFEELRKKDVTIIFVSHDMGTIRQMCSSVLWLENGKQKMVGDSNTVCNEYANSILMKRGKEYEKSIKVSSHNNSQENINLLVEEEYPQISYTNESILNDNVKIVSCYLTDKNYKQVTEVYADERYVLSVVFSSKVKLEKCVIGFVIETPKGVWIVNHNTLMSEIKKTYVVEKNSINKINFSFEMPKIANGEYVIGVAISEGEHENFKVLTWLYNVIYVQVLNVPNNDGILNIDTEHELYSREWVDE